MKRRHAREKALQVLYALDITDTPVDDVIAYVLEEEVGDSTYVNDIVYGVLGQKTKIDELIIRSAENWTLERIAVVERNILRIAVYELLKKSEDAPMKVILDEAIEITKVYTDHKSTKFINGVLSNVYSHMD